MTDPDHLRGLYESAVRLVTAIGRQYADIAADAANIAVTKFLEKVEDGEEISNPEGWVVTAAKNWAHNCIRGNTRHWARLRRPDPPRTPEEVVEQSERRELTNLVVEVAGWLLVEDGDIEMLLGVYSSDKLSISDIAAEYNLHPDAFTKVRFRMERVVNLAADTLLHPRLMKNSRNILATCVERRRGNPDSGIGGEIEEAMGGLRDHSEGRPASAVDVSATMLANTWARIMPVPGRPSMLEKANRRLLAGAAGYVVLEHDAISDADPDGFRDDYEVIRAVRRGLGFDAPGMGQTTFYSF